MLEDHLGDIIGKARTMSGVSAEAAARAAGVTLPELNALEESGQVHGRLRLSALSKLVGLDARKLEVIAAGWSPTPKDLTMWRQLRRVTTTLGSNTVNCYMVWDEASRETALFDTGWRAKPALELIEAKQLRLRHIFITHSHHDHVAALEEIQVRFPGALLHSGVKCGDTIKGSQTGDFTCLGQLRVTWRATHGHTPDGMTYVVDNWPGNAPPVAFVGDAIFAGSIGRGFQSWHLALQKIREQIFTLPPETLICPGHGPLTTVAEEKAHNPFF